MPPFFHPLSLARCDNRTAIARDRPEIAHLLAWLNAGNQVQGLHTVSFDFFIDWSSNQLQRVVWLKRAIASSPHVAQTGPETAEFQVASALEDDTTFDRLASFCRANRLDLSAMVFDDRQDWTSDRSWLIQAWQTTSASGTAIACTTLSMSALKAQIIRLSGGPFTIGRKGLMYGTSCLECTLSHTNALWPGDVDLVFADATSSTPFAIIELKKHTDKSDKSFADQKLSNYYDKDAVKYNRLFLLANQLTKKPIPKFVIYYSTNISENYLIIELVEGTFGKLKGITRQNLLIQVRGPAELANAIVNTIAAMVLSTTRS